VCEPNCAWAGPHPEQFTLPLFGQHTIWEFQTRAATVDDIASKVAADPADQNANENTPHTARMAHDQALAKVMQLLLKDDTQVYKDFVENESFKRFVGDMVYAITSE
jgi:hypothetical protein